MEPTSANARDVRARLLLLTAPYTRPQTRRSLTQLALTLTLWLAAYTAGMVLIQRSWWLGAALSAVASLFVVRLFILQHDCGHRSLFPSHKANDLVGFWLGVITLTPFRCWRRFHALHHSHTGNLDRRGPGDIVTLTVREYQALPPWQRLRYRVYRHPLVLLVLGPPLLFLFRHRTTYKVPRDWRTERHSVHLTNVAIATQLVGVCLCGQALPALVFQALMTSLASQIGAWLFYVQHQFPHAYWKREAEWEHAQASLLGASHCELPQPLRWITADIGLHHLHHLNARIPNYRLSECFDRHPEFTHAPRLGLRDGWRCWRLRLWDEDAQQLVPFPA